VLQSAARPHRSARDASLDSLQQRRSRAAAAATTRTTAS
jgi:hypothetical protein